MPRPRTRSISALGRITVKRFIRRGKRGKRFLVEKPLVNVRPTIRSTVRSEKDYFTIGEKKGEKGQSIREFKDNLVHSKKVLESAGLRAERAAQNMVENAFKAFHERKISERELERIIQKISEKRSVLLEKASSQLRRLNQRDAMITSLFNKEYFRNTFMPNFFAEHKKASLVVIDIDGFSHINKKLGRVEADNAIRLFGQCVNEAARGLEGFGGRFGGDEIWVVLPDGIRDARIFAERLNQILLQRFKEKSFQYLRGNEFTFSGGVSLARENSDIEKVTKLADHRSYVSKEHGKNRITIPTSHGLRTYVLRK